MVNAMGAMFRRGCCRRRRADFRDDAGARALPRHLFQLSGRSAIDLLEVGLRRFDAL